MAAGSISKQVQLLFLDPVFHIPSLTVQIVIQRLRITGQVGYYKARIGPLAVVLGLDDHSTLSVPSCRSVLALGEDSLLLAGLLEFFLGQLQMRLSQMLEDLVFGQTHNLADIVPIAPTQQFPAAKATVPAKDYLYLRPDLTKTSDQ